MSAKPATNFDVRVPGELEAGAYANFMAVWHTPHEFTLDFAVTQPAQVSASEDLIQGESTCRAAWSPASRSRPP